MAELPMNALDIAINAGLAALLFVAACTAAVVVIAWLANLSN